MLSTRCYCQHVSCLKVITNPIDVYNVCLFYVSVTSQSASANNYTYTVHVPFCMGYHFLTITDILQAINRNNADQLQSFGYFTTPTG